MSVSDSEILTPRQRLNLSANAVCGVFYDWDTKTNKVIRTDTIKDLLGFDPKEIPDDVGWWESRIHPEDRERVRKTFLTSESRCEVEYRMLHREGHYLHIWDQALILRDEKGSLRRVIGSNLNINSRKELERALVATIEAEKQARREAETADRAKDEFLAVISHELRSPLQAILGWIRMIRTGNLEKGTLERGYEVIERSVRSQIGLIEDLLDLSRINRGELNITRSRLDLKELLTATTDALKLMAEGKNIRVSCDFSEGLFEVEGDANRLQQVFSNLLQNAIKFSPKNSSVLVTAANAGAEVKISVIDFGIGIDKMHFRSIFDRFSQADSSTSRQHGGLGLGLSIAKHLTEIHGGRIEASSDGQGKGSTFSVWLPRCGQTTVNLKKELGERALSPDVSRQGLSGVTIMLVEDDPDSSDLIANILEGEGARVVSFPSAKEAIREYEIHMPDLLISDLAMPGEDGYMFVRKLKEHPLYLKKNIPLASLSAFASSADREKALSAGFDLHLTKPIDPQDLTRALLTLLAGEKPNRRIKLNVF